MFWGKVFSAAFGPTGPQIYDITGELFAGGVRAIVRVRPQWRERNYAIFANGVFIGVEYCDARGNLTIVIPRTIGTVIQSFYMEDVGALAEVPSDTLPYLLQHVRRQEGLTANCANFVWSASGRYSITSLAGNTDTQISGVTITGAKRNSNVQPIQNWPQRSRLYFSVHNVSGTRIVRWWNGNRIVAEGSRSGNGAVTCEEVGESGITVTCTVTYTSGIKQGEAWADLKWPRRYKIYYSTSAINYSAAPQAYVEDHGGEAFTYLASALAAGTYNWNIVPEDDEGHAESAPSTPETFTINTVPAAPTITGVTQVITAPTLYDYTSNNDTSSSATAAITPGGSNRYLLVFVEVPAGGIVNGCTFGATAMTQIATASGSSVELYTFGLANPAASLDTITATLFASYDWAIYAIAISNTAGVADTDGILATSAASASSSRPAVPTGGNRFWCVAASVSSGTVALSAAQGGTLITTTGRGATPTGADVSAIGSDDSGAYGVTTNATADLIIGTGVAFDGVPGATTVNWTNGETGCTYNVYASRVNGPVNFGDLVDGPAPVATGLNATSQSLGTLTALNEDYTSDYAAMLAAIDAAVSTCSTVFAAGETGFSAAFTTLAETVRDEVNTFGDAMGLGLREIDEELALNAASVTAQLESIAGLFATSEWQYYAGLYYGEYLKLVGGLIADTPFRYLMPNGAIPGSLLAGATLGTDTAGEQGTTVAPTGRSLLTIASPLAKPNEVRVIVRAVKGGIEEQNNQVYIFRLNDGGVVKSRPPGRAYVQSITQEADSPNVNVTVSVYCVDLPEAPADHFALFLTSESGTIDVTGNPFATVTATAGNQNTKTGTFDPLALGPSYFKFAVVARTADGTPSAQWDTYYVDISNDTPNTLTDKAVYVVRGRGQ